LYSQFSFSIESIKAKVLNAGITTANVDEHAFIPIYKPHVASTFWLLQLPAKYFPAGSLISGVTVRSLAERAWCHERWRAAHSWNFLELLRICRTTLATELSLKHER